MIDQHVEDPQSWNLYGYGRNNPLRGVDDDGHVWHIVAGAGGGYLIGGGIELGKQLVKGEPLDWQRVNAKAVNSAIVGGTAAATGGLSEVAAGFALGTASALGGVIERAADGDESTNPLDRKLLIADAVVGGAFGAAGQHGQNLAVEGAKKTGEVTRTLTRGESFVRQGVAANDPAKIAKGETIKAAAKAAAISKAGNPGATALAIKQEVLGEVTSTLRKE